jgi:predicted MFS family arabinose efflux permease
MSLPTRVLDPAARSIGMGVFYTVYFFGVMLGPALGGRYAALVGSAGAAFDFGAAMLLVCPFALWIFHRTTNGLHPPAQE